MFGRKKKVTPDFEDEALLHRAADHQIERQREQEVSRRLIAEFIDARLAWEKMVGSDGGFDDAIADRHDEIYNALTTDEFVAATQQIDGVKRERARAAVLARLEAEKEVS